MELNFQGVMAANVTPFTPDGSQVDHDALARLGSWLSTVPGITGVVCNGHAGEGTSLSDAERADVVATLVEAVDGRPGRDAGAAVLNELLFARSVLRDGE